MPKSKPDGPAAMRSASTTSPPRPRSTTTGPATGRELRPAIVPVRRRDGVGCHRLRPVHQPHLLRRQPRRPRVPARAGGAGGGCPRLPRPRPAPRCASAGRGARIVGVAGGACPMVACPGHRSCAPRRCRSRPVDPNRRGDPNPREPRRRDRVGRPPCCERPRRHRLAPRRGPLEARPPRSRARRAESSGGPRAWRSDPRIRASTPYPRYRSTRAGLPAATA
jgi:hypothetical protein